MKLNSKYFDSIRVSASRAREETSPEQHPPCQWKGCDKAGSHRAPKGRGNDGQYYHFCIDHVRHYNASYNYFDGMSDAEVRNFQKDALTGHRPTWKMGAGTTSEQSREGSKGMPGVGKGRVRAHDPHHFFAWRAQKQQDEAARRQVRPLERKSLEALGLSQAASKAEIKSRFKELVKRHHPDANGGDNRSEDKLREIIQAYNYLKQSGLV